MRWVATTCNHLRDLKQVRRLKKFAFREPKYYICKWYTWTHNLVWRMQGRDYVKSQKQRLTHHGWSGNLDVWLAINNSVKEIWGTPTEMIVWLSKWRMNSRLFHQIWWDIWYLIDLGDGKKNTAGMFGESDWWPDDSDEKKAKGWSISRICRFVLT